MGCVRLRMLVAFVASSRAGAGLLLEVPRDGTKLAASGGEGRSGQPSTSALMAVLVQSYEREVTAPWNGLEAAPRGLPPQARGLFEGFVTPPQGTVTPNSPRGG